MKEEDVIRATPTTRWSEVVMEEGGVVSKLASLGARIARGGILFVERPNLSRVTEWLRERGMTWQQVPGYAIEEAVKLGEMDPASLVNSILFDPEHPYNWEKREEQEWYPDYHDIEFAKERNVVRTPDMTKHLDLDTAAFTRLNKQTESFDQIFEEVLAELNPGRKPYGNPRSSRSSQVYVPKGPEKKAPDELCWCDHPLSQHHVTGLLDQKRPCKVEGCHCDEFEPREVGEAALDHGWQDDDTTDHPRTESSDPEAQFYEDLRVKLARSRKMKEASSSSSGSSSGSQSAASSSSSASSGTPDSESSEGDGLTGMGEKSEAGTYSTDPSYNPCALFMRSFCRIDGRPCLYRKDTYKDCPKRGTGLKMSKKALAIPPGEEDNTRLNKSAVGA